LAIKSPKLSLDKQNGDARTEVNGRSGAMRGVVIRRKKRKGVELRKKAVGKICREKGVGQKIKGVNEKSTKRYTRPGDSTGCQKGGDT